MKLRVQVAFSCLAVIVLVMVLLFGERSAGSLDVRQERILIKETPDQVIPVLSKALTDNSPDVRAKTSKTRVTGISHDFDICVGRLRRCLEWT